MHTRSNRLPRAMAQADGHRTEGKGVQAMKQQYRPFSRAGEHEAGPMGTAGPGLGLFQWQHPLFHDAASGKQRSITYEITIRRRTVYSYVSAGVYVRDRNI